MNKMKEAVCMPCTEAQFAAMRPKLETIEGLIIVHLNNWDDASCIVNNLGNKSNLVSNLRRISNNWGRVTYHEFNEQIFLEACGYQTSEEKDRDNATNIEGHLNQELPNLKPRWTTDSMKHIIIVTGKDILELAYQSMKESFNYDRFKKLAISKGFSESLHGGDAAIQQFLLDKGGKFNSEIGRVYTKPEQPRIQLDRTKDITEAPETLSQRMANLTKEKESLPEQVREQKIKHAIDLLKENGYIIHKQVVSKQWIEV